MMDASLEVMVACFALGTGAGDPQLAVVARQMAEDLAEVLTLRPGFVTLSPALLVEEGGSSLQGGRLRSAFATFFSLPETRWVRATAGRLGAQIAVSGRLIGEGKEVHLGVNAVDIARGTLLFCTQQRGGREEVPSLLCDAGERLLSAFSGEARPRWRSAVQSQIGTGHFRAYTNWSMARDMERQEALGLRRMNRSRWLERLCFALGDDAAFHKVSRVLVSALESGLSPAELQVILKGLKGVSDKHLAPMMVLAEAQRQAGALAEARGTLRSAVRRHEGSGALWFMLGEIESALNLPSAAECLRRGGELDPRLRRA